MMDTLFGEDFDTAPSVDCRGLIAYVAYAIIARAFSFERIA